MKSLLIHIKSICFKLFKSISCSYHLYSKPFDLLLLLLLLLFKLTAFCRILANGAISLPFKTNTKCSYLNIRVNDE
jgi:hypothetical protein